MELCSYGAMERWSYEARELWKLGSIWRYAREIWRYGAMEIGSYGD